MAVIIHVQPRISSSQIVFNAEEGPLQLIAHFVGDKRFSLINRASRNILSQPFFLSDREISRIFFHDEAFTTEDLRFAQRKVNRLLKWLNPNVYQALDKSNESLGEELNKIKEMTRKILIPQEQPPSDIIFYRTPHQKLKDRRILIVILLVVFALIVGAHIGLQNSERNSAISGILIFFEIACSLGLAYFAIQTFLDFKNDRSQRALRHEYSAFTRLCANILEKYGGISPDPARIRRGSPLWFTRVFEQGVTFDREFELEELKVDA